jgi:hypothetical protein
MRYACILAAFILGFALCAVGQPRTFDWVRASDENAQLDPADFHAGRVYRPGPDGGNIHVDIQSSQPVTIAMATADSWTDAQQHPEAWANLSFSCIREHVVSTTYECHLPPQTPMVLLVRDERTPNRAIMTGIGAIMRAGAARQFISPNDLRISYYRWDCVANCIQPEFQWVLLVKEKYELTSVPKTYSVLTPERDGQQVNVKFKAPIPMTIAVVPSKIADQIYDNPASANSVLSGSSCKQRGIQKLTFDCTVNLADGPQSLVILPDTNVPSHKKAEIEMQTVKCIANCSFATN